MAKALIVCGLLALIAGLFGAAWPAQAQGGRAVEPHLGYGVHWGPNTDVSPDYVKALGFDWVKVYTPESAIAFPNMRVLYRMDLGWPGNWEQFKADIAARARNIASLPIAAIEVHNEPNLRNEWGGNVPNAWQYVQVLRVAYQAIKSVKPSLVVVSGGLAPTITTADRGAQDDLDFAREMFENGAGQWFDAFGYHPYGYNAPPETDPFGQQPLVFRRTERIRALMERYGIYKQVWLTEFGWLRDPSEDGFQCQDADPNFSGFAWMRVSGQQQADYLARAFQYAHENWPWAGPMFVWNLNFMQMDWLGACNHMKWFGLLRHNGEPTLAYRTLQTMPRYFSDYQPRLQIIGEPPRGDISLLCAEPVVLGTLRVANIGYPGSIDVVIQPVNPAGAPVFIEADPVRLTTGGRVTIYAVPTGRGAPGQYPVYINVRTVVNGRPSSQSLQGVVLAWGDNQRC